MSKHNELIANYMGHKKSTIKASNGLTLYSIPKKLYGNVGNMFVNYKAMRYNKSWDWLIPVLDKIYDSEQYYNYIHENSGQFEFSIDINTKYIKNTYNDVIDFIKWFNELN